MLAGRGPETTKFAIALLVAASLLVAAVVALVSLLQAPMYEAHAELRAGLQEGSDGRPTHLEIKDVAPVVADVARGRPVAQEVAQRSEAGVSSGELLDHLDAQPVMNTPLVRLTYADTDPQRTKRVANALGRVTAESASETSLGTSVLSATFVHRASLPDEPARPKPLRNGLVALVIGLALSAALLAGREFRRRRRS